MLNYDAYRNSSEGGKSLMMRRLFEQHTWMMGMVEKLSREVDELKREKAARESGKGVPSLIIEMGKRTKPPNIIA